VPARPPAAPTVGRRAALLGLAATLVAAGCDTGDDLGEPDPTGSPSPSASTAEEPDQTPDEALVDDVLARLTAALAVLAQARRAPLLRQPVTQLLRSHRRHVEVLEGEPAEPAPPGPSPDPAASLRSVRRSETDLQAALVDAAGRAESGALAKLLASMSASVAQHVALLPEQAG
jgi:hypothetical protein